MIGDQAKEIIFLLFQFLQIILIFKNIIVFTRNIKPILSKNIDDRRSHLVPAFNRNGFSNVV